MQRLEDATVAVIGLGYVGLPLAVALAREFPVIGYDANPQRIAELRGGEDRTREVGREELAGTKRLELTADAARLREAQIFIVTVPTPVDAHKVPDLGPLRHASETVGRAISPGALIVYESTVYPGATEEICVPIIETASGLACNRDFFVGYSPERINPGDRTHRIGDIVKVTSGSTPEAAELVDALYRRIVRAGTHRASSIRVAEAAKVIENTQRDVNIALVNELAMLFERLGLDTQEVLAAAGTKWNFAPFKPGLVGGHCIGVDPYYLTYKAIAVGHHPEMILAGRRINDGMGRYVAEQVMKLLVRRRVQVAAARILVLGLAFKENCPDLRNSRVIDVVRELESYSATVKVHDPWVAPDAARDEYGLELLAAPEKGAYDAVILAVPHRDFAKLGAAGIRAFGRPGAPLYDIKGLLPRDDVDGRL
ncbi:MAG: nucleotide sugar dehydrogenase [Gammaproteobacteria bacterium]